MARSRFSVVLLDIDGTLLDSNDAHALSWCETLRRHGREVPFGKVRPLIGMGGDRLLPEVAGLEEDSDEGRRISDERRTCFLQAHLPRLRPTPGARGLVEGLRRRGLVLVVATSAGEQEVRALLRQAGVEDLLPERTTSSDAQRSKPAPDIVQAALQRVGARPGQAVMVGDTPYDIASARAAGVTPVALRCGGGWRDEDLEGAAALFDDPRDLLEGWDGFAAA